MLGTGMGLRNFVSFGSRYVERLLGELVIGGSVFTEAGDFLGAKEDP